MDTPTSTPEPKRGTSQFVDRYLTENAERLAWEIYEKRVATILVYQKGEFFKGHRNKAIEMFPPQAAEIQGIGQGLAEALFNERHEILFDIGEALEEAVERRNDPAVVATLAALVALIRKRGPDHGVKTWGNFINTGPHRWGAATEKVIAEVQQEARDEVQRERLTVKWNEDKAEWGKGEWSKETDDGAGRSATREGAGEAAQESPNAAPAQDPKPAAEPVGSGESVAGGQRGQHPAPPRPARKTRRGERK